MVTYIHVHCTHAACCLSLLSGTCSVARCLHTPGQRPGAQDNDTTPAHRRRGSAIRALAFTLAGRLAGAYDAQLARGRLDLALAELRGVDLARVDGVEAHRGAVEAVGLVDLGEARISRFDKDNIDALQISMLVCYTDPARRTE